MPRNIKVTFDDGSEHIYQNAPDSITPQQVNERAQRDFGKSIVNIDGGKQNTSVNEQTETPEARSARYRNEGASEATELPSFPILPAAAAGFARSLYGLPERVAAAPLAYLPSSITGEPKDITYPDALNEVRGLVDAEMNRSTLGSILGTLGGSYLGGGALVKGAKALGGPAIAKLLTLNRGAKTTLPNIGKLAAISAATGAAQSAGEGSNVGEGALVGGLTGAGVSALSGVVKPIVRAAGDRLNLTSDDGIIKRLVGDTSKEDFANRVNDFKATTNNANPTVFEMLDPSDRSRVTRNLVYGLLGTRDKIADRTNRAINQRLSNIGAEMQKTIDSATQQRAAQLQEELNAAKVGGSNTNPLAIDQYRDLQARNIMDPYRDTPVANSVSHLIDPNYEPNSPTPNGDVASLIRRAASSLNQRVGPTEESQQAKNPITFGEANAILSRLRDFKDQAGPDRLIAEDAIEHLENRLNDLGPVQELKNSYAANSRFLEGVQEGRRGRLERDVPQPTQALRNAYRSNEGNAGRFFGQRDQLSEQFENRPDQNIDVLNNLSNGDTRAIAQNLGSTEAESIKNAANAQSQSANNLLQAFTRSKNSDVVSKNIAKNLIKLTPLHFAQTKFLIATNLITGHHIPEKRANTIADMIFSTQPSMIKHALNILAEEPEGAEAMRNIAATLGAVSGQATQERR